MKFTAMKHFEFVEIEVTGAARVWECGDLLIHEQIFPGSRQFLASLDTAIGRIWLTENDDIMRFKTPEEAAEEALKQWI